MRCVWYHMMMQLMQYSVELLQRRVQVQDHRMRAAAAAAKVDLT